MKVKTIKDVHIRAREPFVKGDSNKKGILYPGFELDVAEEVQGEEIGNNSLWYKDKNGDYYWSGGFESINDKIYKQSFDFKLNYNEVFQQVPLKFRKTLGEGVKIAILDSGINTTHIAFKDKNIIAFNATDDNNGIEDTVGHGSHVSGLICAEGGDYIGIAPNSEIYVSKVINKNGIVYHEAVISALEWAIEQRVDIINMSLSVHKRYKEKLYSIIKKAYEADIVLVSSAGENEYISRQEHFLYPSYFNECISVGAVSNEFLKNNTSNQFNTRLEYLMNYGEYISCGLNLSNYANNKGSSMSSAIISGIICLLLARRDGSMSRNIYCRELLDQFAIEYQEINDDLNNYQLIRIS